MAVKEGGFVTYKSRVGAPPEHEEEGGSVHLDATDEVSIPDYVIIDFVYETIASRKDANFWDLMEP